VISIIYLCDFHQSTSISFAFPLQKELSGRRKKGSGGRQKADGTEGKQQRKKGPVHDTVLLPRDEMLQNCLLYLLLLQHKKIPAKKADIVKHAMNGQTREFEELFKDLSSILNHVMLMLC